MNRPILSALAAALVLLLAASLLLDSPSPSVDAFEEWKKTYGRQWPVQQEPYRRMVFLRELAEVSRHNANASRTYDKGINQFSAMTEQEFKATVGMSVSAFQTKATQVKDADFRPNGVVDWVARGMVTPIKDQGACGSCWAFTSIALAESWALFTKQGQYDLSQQQLVDCQLRNNGCNGGSIFNGLHYILNSGVVDEIQYPYVAKQQQCLKSGGRFQISNFQGGMGGSCEALYNSIDAVVFGVAVNSDGWKSYRSGVFSDCNTAAQHAVVLVGATRDYWKIKNSWGTSWGEQGYIRLAMGNTCGICLYDTYLIASYT